MVAVVRRVVSIKHSGGGGCILREVWDCGDSVREGGGGGGDGVASWW